MNMIIQYKYFKFCSPTAKFIIKFIQSFLSLFHWVNTYLQIIITIEQNTLPRIEVLGIIITKQNVYHPNEVFSIKWILLRYMFVGIILKL